jgi:hypothetical protein
LEQKRKEHEAKHKEHEHAQGDEPDEPHRK